jgi:hypothetical protein
LSIVDDDVAIAAAVDDWASDNPGTNNEGVVLRILIDDPTVLLRDAVRCVSLERNEAAAKQYGLET